MLKRRIKKLTKAMVRAMKGSKWLVCKECEENEVMVAMDTKAVTCGECVQSSIAPPPVTQTKKEKSDKPRGWHFKAYFEHGGKVYSRGEEITDKNQITKLKKEFGGKSSTPAKKVDKTPKKRGRKNAKSAR